MIYEMSHGEKISYSGGHKNRCLSITEWPQCFLSLWLWAITMNRGTLVTIFVQEQLKGISTFLGLNKHKS